MTPSARTSQTRQCKQKPQPTGRRHVGRQGNSLAVSAERGLAASSEDLSGLHDEQLTCCGLSTEGVANIEMVSCKGRKVGLGLASALRRRNWSDLTGCCRWTFTLNPTGPSRLSTTE